jgi:DNA-binding MarR family transcriptional regulator
VTAQKRFDLDNYLPYLVNRVGGIIAEQFGGETLAPHGLTIAMWRVMAVLASKGDQRQIDLAGFTSIEVSTLSRLVTRLIRMGLVSRSRSPRSPREVAVRLTAKSEALMARLVPLARGCEADAIAGLPPEDLVVLKRSLRRIYDNMKSRAAAKVPLPRPATRRRPRG